MKLLTHAEGNLLSLLTHCKQTAQITNTAQTFKSGICLFSVGRPKMSYAMAKTVTVLRKPTISVVSVTFTISQRV